MSTDTNILEKITGLAREAGDRLMALYDPAARPTTRAALSDALRRNEDAVSFLQDKLKSVRPETNWLPETMEAVDIPDGEWWVVDAVEGNVNHVHGTGDWCVSITLVRDGVPVLAVVRQPVGNLTYIGAQGSGVHVNGARLRVAAKRDLADAIVLTGQAEHGQVDTYDAIASSVRVMLDRALLVRASVPSTFPMLDVAAGHADVFWQYQPTLPGVAAGVLMAREAGGVVTRIDGSSWRPGDPDILVSNAALQPLATDVLVKG